MNVLRSSLLLVLALLLLFGTGGCTSTRRPLLGMRPREVGTFGGEIAIGSRPVADVTSCSSQRTISKDGTSDAAEFQASDDLSLKVASAPAPAQLTIGSKSGAARTMSLTPNECAEHRVHFFQRNGILHGSVSLDCTTSEGRVKVAARFDNCGPPVTPYVVETKTTPVTREQNVR